MKTPQKSLEAINRILNEEVDYSQVTKDDLEGIAQEIEKAERALNTIKAQSQKVAINKRVDLFVDIANGN